MAIEEAVLAAIKAAKPVFRDDHDRVAFAAHAAVLASGYSLVAAGRSVDAEPSEAKESEATSSWKNSNGTYAFRYAADDDPERTMILKGTAMGESLMLDAAADSRTTNTELKVKDYVADTSNSSYARQYKNLRLLVEHVERDILKDLYPPIASAKSTSRSSQGKTETSRLIEGENQPQWQPAQGSGLYVPNQGHDDLYPASGLGVFPMQPDMPGLMGGVGIPGGGGMLLGPNDPRWLGVGSSQGPYGGGLPPGVPAGARFDPYGPFGVPGFEPDRFGGEGGRGPRPGPHVHPDVQHFYPF